jgi:hypothetical protein
MGNVVSLAGRLVVHRTRDEVDRDRRQRAQDRRVAATRAQASRQRAMRLQRTAPWANWRAIENLHMEAARLTRVTGVKHEVDHIIPLLGETVSGLHVESNMRVVTKAANRAKSNHFDERMVGGAGIEPATSTV